MFKTSLRPNSSKIMIDIPSFYIGKDIEIIAYDVNEINIPYNEQKVQYQFLDSVSISTKAVKFNREEANER